MLFITDRIVTSNVFSKNQIEFITQHTSDSTKIVSKHKFCAFEKKIQ